MTGSLKPSGHFKTNKPIIRNLLIELKGWLIVTLFNKPQISIYHEEI